jgi:hypothetical protein
VGHADQGLSHPQQQAHLQHDRPPPQRALIEVERYGTFY